MDNNLSPLKSIEDCEISEKRQSELVKFFSKTTGLDYTNSRHWLESANWKIDGALKNFEAQRYGTSDEDAFRPPRPLAGQVDSSSDVGSGPAASVKPQSDACAMSSTKPADKPLFSGKGKRLGGPEEMRNILPPPMAADVPIESCSSATGSAVKLSAEKEALFLAGYESSRPQTTLQIRFPDCSRVVVHGNCSHTVGDVRRFIAQKKPELKAKTVKLSTNFPRKELTDDTQSLQSADVLNAMLLVTVVR